MNAEDMQRFEVDPTMVSWDDPGIWLRHDCGWHFETAEATTLAELVQRAEEHTEVCR